MKCEKCGKEIDHLLVNIFNHDGSDRECSEPLQECEEDAVYFDTSMNWTGAELSEDEQVDTIRCPECGEFPFKSKEIQTYEFIRVVMFKEVQT